MALESHHALLTGRAASPLKYMVLCMHCMPTRRIRKVRHVQPAPRRACARRVHEGERGDRLPLGRERVTALGLRLEVQIDDVLADALVDVPAGLLAIVRVHRARNGARAILARERLREKPAEGGPQVLQLHVGRRQEERRAKPVPLLADADLRG